MRRLLTVLIGILFPLCALAAPSVTSYTGTMSNGESIVISGTDFGTTGPTIKMFDNFESGTAGNYISNGSTNAVIGQWFDCGVNCTPTYFSTYSSDFAVSGTKSSRQNWSVDSQDGARWMGLDFGTPSTEVYISYWMLIPSGQNIPGSAGPCAGGGPNIKPWWLSANGVYASDYGFQSIDATSPHDMAFGPIDGGESRAGGTNAPDFYDYHSSIWTTGRWMRADVYLHGSTSTQGSITAWLMDSANNRYLWQTSTGAATLDAGDSTGWRYLHIPGYARCDSNSNTYYDDIYVATGSGARARVEIGNNSTYTSCTNLAVCTPTSWGNTSITATVRSGSFTTGTAYLFVTDSSGVTSAGKEITLGESGGDPAPAPPTLSNVTISGGSFR